MPQTEYEEFKNDLDQERYQNLNHGMKEILEEARKTRLALERAIWVLVLGSGSSVANTVVSRKPEIFITPEPAPIERRQTSPQTQIFQEPRNGQ